MKLDGVRDAAEAKGPPEALVSLVREGVGGVERERVASGRARFVAVAGAPKGGRRRIGILAVSAALLAVAFFAIGRRGTQGERQTLREIVAPAGGAQIAFADATSLRLAAGAVARVDERGAAGGGQVVLKEGRAELAVRDGSSARWQVSAGPFLVRVLGARFAVSWTESRRVFAVNVADGTVEVRGPGIDGALPLRAGDSYSSDVGSSAPPASSAEPETREEAPAAAAPEHRVRAAAKARASRGWGERVRAGAFAEVVAEAEGAGLGLVLAQAPLEELAALADAARYERRSELAARALSTLRSRFPRTEAAHEAAFHLGRIDESVHGPSARARSWYERYAAEAPRGAYAAEALARRASVVVALEGEAAARPLAEEYLRRFPAGPFAPSARTILRR